MARFGSHRDLSWKKGWYPLHSQINGNTRRVFHPCVVVGAACTKCTPWPTVPKHTEPPDRSMVKTWAHISRLPAEQGRGAKTGTRLLEGTWKFKARKIFILAFLETLPAISNIFSWQHERRGSKHVCLSLKHCWSDGHFGKGDKNVSLWNSSCFPNNPLRLRTAHRLEATRFLSAHPYLSLKYSIEDQLWQSDRESFITLKSLSLFYKAWPKFYLSLYKFFPI